MRVLLALAPLLAGAAAQAADVPSGQEVTLHEVLVDPQLQATYLRFRFIAPAVARGEGQPSFDVVSADMLHLCENLVVPYLAEHDLQGDEIVITFMDQYTEFGQFDPDRTQFIETFLLEDGICIWGQF